MQDKEPVSPHNNDDINSLPDPIKKVLKHMKLYILEDNKIKELNPSAIIHKNHSKNTK